MNDYGRRMSEPSGEDAERADGPAGPVGGDPLPLFPLSSVLFPGAPLPLHVFEQRYRDLVAELLSRPEGELRRFGVVAIRSGRESGPAIPDLHAIGCAAAVRSVSPYADGRADVLSMGVGPFGWWEVDSASKPSLVGRVEWLSEPHGEQRRADALVEPVQA